MAKRKPAPPPSSAVVWQSWAPYKNHDPVAIHRFVEEARGLRPALPAKELLARSRDPRAPTHTLFEWNDGKAAEAHRLSQARQLLRSFKLVYRSDSRAEARANSQGPTTFAVRYYQHSKVLGGYAPTELVLQRADARSELLDRARRDWEAYAAKYGHLEELASAIDAMSAALTKKKAKAR